MNRTSLHDAESGVSLRNPLFVLICILFTAINMRSPITAISPLLDLIRHDFAVSNTMAGFLTTIPLVAFAILSPFVAKLAGKYGMERIIIISLMVLTIGGWLRPFGGLTMLLLGTFLTGLAIAIVNVILPGMIKREFPFRVGIMTSIYSICMNVFAATASAVSLPLANTGLGWKGSILVWTVLAMVALILWIPQQRYNQPAKLMKHSVKATRSVWHSPLAWKITIFMGMQSMIFYVSIAWLPDILQEQGLTNIQSGYMLSLMQFSMLPFNFIIPILAAKLKTQRPLVLFTVLLYLISLLGIIFVDGYLWWTATCLILLGIAGASSFSLSMMFFSLRTHTANQAADLSGMSQSIGYLLAACGPTLFGILHDMTGNWTLPLSILVIATFIILYTGLMAGGKGFIHPEEKSTLIS